MLVFFPSSYEPPYDSVYGIISFDVDLSSLYINQCDYASEEEMDKDMRENPLHVFRGTHKCDRNSSVVRNIRHYTAHKFLSLSNFHSPQTPNR